MQSLKNNAAAGRLTIMLIKLRLLLRTDILWVIASSPIIETVADHCDVKYKTDVHCNTNAESSAAVSSEHGSRPERTSSFSCRNI